MGYTTTFEGQISVEPPLNAAEVSFLRDFCQTRHYQHVYGPLSIDVEDSDFVNTSDPGIFDYNKPHYSQPALWCNWEATEDGTAIQWNEAEKSYGNEEWVRYLINCLFSENARAYVERWDIGDPRVPLFTFDHVFNGSVEAMGEEPGDHWKLNVKDNVVSRKDAIFIFDEE